MKYIDRKKKEWGNKALDQRLRQRSNYPAAPSAGKGIVRVYEKLLLKAVRGKKHWRALVLGATPETRDLVLKHGGELVTADISWNAMQMAYAHMKHAQDPREIIVRSNWLALPLAGHYFDVILGDGVTNNIDFKFHHKFYREMTRLLKKDGKIILREVVINPKRPLVSFREEDKKYCASKMHWFDMFMDIYLYNQRKSEFTDSKKYIWKMKKFWQLVHQAYQTGQISKRTFNAIWWFRGSIKHIFLPHPLFERGFKKFFKLLPVKQATDHDFTQDSMIFFYGKIK